MGCVVTSLLVEKVVVVFVFVSVAVALSVVVIIADILLVACRDTFWLGVSRPEWEETANEEPKGTGVEGKVDCGKKKNSVSAFDSRDSSKDMRGGSLTEPPPGGLTWPELESTAPVAPGADDPVATQGQTLGVTNDEVCLWVPLHGIGTLSTVAVTAGADSVDLGSASLLPFTLPPSAVMDFHEPLWSP